MISLGQRIRELRLQKKMTQVDLARELCTPSMISQIESDRAKPSFKMLHHIAERLQVDVDKLLSDSEINLGYVSSYRMAKAMAGAKLYEAAIPLLRELLVTPRAHISSMEIMYELGECLLYIQQFDEAEDFLDQVQEIAVLRKDHRQQALVLRRLGQLESSRKSYALALYHLQKAYSQAELMTEQDQHLKADILYWIGEVHAKQGRRDASYQHYEEAMKLYDGNESLNGIGHAYLGLGIAYKDSNDLEKSVEYSDMAWGIFEGINSMLTVIEAQVSFAVIKAENGRIEEANVNLQDAIRKLLDLGRREEAGGAYMELAKVKLLEGELEAAEEACREAGLLLPPDQIGYAWVNRIQAMIHDRQEKMDDAIRLYRSAADGFKRLQEIGLWGDTMHELSHLYRRNHETAEAFEIMEQVREHTHSALIERGICL